MSASHRHIARHHGHRAPHAHPAFSGQISFALFCPAFAEDEGVANTKLTFQFPAAKMDMIYIILSIDSLMEINKN